MSDTFEIPAGEHGSPGRPPLADVLNAGFAAERWQRRGRLSQRIVVLASVGMAYQLFARGGASAIGGGLLLALWLTAMILLAISLIAGKGALDRADRLVAASGGRRIRRDPPPGRG